MTTSVLAESAIQRFTKHLTGTVIRRGAQGMERNGRPFAGDHRAVSIHQ
jgi:hypothetical protein